MGEIESASRIEIDGLMTIKPKGKIPKNYDPSYTNSLKYAVNKPISFLVKKLSKSHKNNVRYYQTIAGHGSTIASNKKYNPEIVMELTGLKREEVTNFIQYLDLDLAFIQRASEYEIAVRVLSEYETYKKRKG